MPFEFVACSTPWSGDGKLELMLVLLISVILQLATAVPPPVRIDARARRAVIVDLSRQLHARYVYPDSVQRIEEDMDARRRSGAYDSAATATSFAARLTEDLRRFDLHFDVRFDPELEKKLRAAGSD